MSDKLHDKIYQINCLTEEVDSLYHQAALKLGVSDSVMFVLYMLHIGGEKCLLYDIYKLSGISKQTINSAIRKLENDGIVYLEKHNGKSKIVCVTEKGKAYIAQTGARLAEAATKNPAVFLRKERFIRPDQHDHGRLRHTGNSILTLDPGAGRSLHFHCTVCIRCPDDPEIRHRNRCPDRKYPPCKR